jgi:hypothetical protein
MLVMVLLMVGCWARSCGVVVCGCGRVATSGAVVECVRRRCSSQHYGFGRLSRRWRGQHQGVDKGRRMMGGSGVHFGSLRLELLIESLIEEATGSGSR